MSLRAKISADLKEALKLGDDKRLSTLRLLWSAIRNAEIARRREELDDEGVQTAAAQQVKQLRDALQDFEKGGRQDLVDGAKNEISVLEEYLPEQMGDEELRIMVKKIIQDSGVSGLSEAGRVIGMAMKELKGRADGKKVRELITEILSS